MSTWLKSSPKCEYEASRWMGSQPDPRGHPQLRGLVSVSPVISNSLWSYAELRVFLKAEWSPSRSPHCMTETPTWHLTSLSPIRWWNLGPEQWSRAPCLTWGVKDRVRAWTQPSPCKVAEKTLWNLEQKYTDQGGLVNNNSPWAKSNRPPVKSGS